jgi:hypothetical protein
MFRKMVRHSACTPLIVQGKFLNDSLQYERALVGLSVARAHPSLTYVVMYIQCPENSQRENEWISFIGRKLLRWG